MMERLALTATALCHRVERITVRETVECSRLVGEALKQIGFGQDPEAMRRSVALDALWEKFMFTESIALVSTAIYGRVPDRIEHRSTYEPAKQDIVIDCMTIAEGTVGLIQHEFIGWLDQSPRLELGMTWYHKTADPQLKQGGGSDLWTIEIEGYPCSLRMNLEALASIARNEELHPGDPTIPTYHATAAVIVQAIPVVCEALPGIVYPRIFSHCTADPATLGTRRTIAG
jgi:2,4-diaminopentanoate dehydrogenase